MPVSSVARAINGTTATPTVHSNKKAPLRTYPGEIAGGSADKWLYMGRTRAVSPCRLADKRSTSHSFVVIKLLGPQQKRTNEIRSYLLIELTTALGTLGLAFAQIGPLQYNAITGVVLFVFLLSIHFSLGYLTFPTELQGSWLPIRYLLLYGVPAIIVFAFSIIFLSDSKAHLVIDISN